MRKLLTIGEAARLVGVTPKAIRHYHKIGLLPELERSEAGYRLYGAAELLRLGRIRRLKSLGIPLGRAKGLLGDADDRLSMRETLKALHAELSVEIDHLKERRARIEELLAREDLDSIEDAGEPSPTFEIMRERLEKRLPETVSAEAWALEEKIWATLDAFEWPEGYRETWETVAQQFAERPEGLRRMVALGERMAALADLPEDSPEVERLAEDMARFARSNPFPEELSEQPPWAEDRLGVVYSDLLMANFSPAQRRVIELANEYESRDGETTVSRAMRGLREEARRW